MIGYLLVKNKFLSMVNNMRKVGLDIARIIAMIAVIGVHTISHYVGPIVSMCVGLFVIISGSLIMDNNKEFDYKKWIKSILRIVVAFIFWSTIYTILLYPWEGLYSFLHQVMCGHYHLWFCYMIVGVYLTIPILKYIKKNRNLYLYLFTLLLILSIILPTLEKITPFFGIMQPLEWLRIFRNMEYVFYFMLGDILVSEVKSIKLNVAIILSGFISLALIYLLAGSDDTDLRTVLYAASLFIIINKGGSLIKNIKICNVLQFLSKQCFTVYLVHVLIIEYMNLLNIKVTPVSLFFIVTAISFILASVLNLLTNYVISLLPVTKRTHHT